MLTKSKSPVLLVILVLAVASLAGGAYVGYQSGYENQRQQLEPELRNQININTNLIKLNEALNQALTNASNLGIVKIGYIASTPTDEELSGAFIEEIIQPDLNAYASKLGYNVTFQFVIKTVLNGEAGDHLIKTQEMKKMGIDLVISGGWSSMLSASRAYVNDNDMLLVGTTSTSPFLTIPSERLYRMIPPDSNLPSALASIMWSYGIKSVIIFQRGDSWGDGVVMLFEPAWTGMDGTFAGEVIRYPPEKKTDFSVYLQAANRQAQAAKETYPEGDRVAILLLAEDEDGVIVSEMENYLPLYDCVMFSGYSHIGLKSDVFIGSLQASHLKVFTPSPQPFGSSIFEGLKARYPNLRDSDAYLYDSAWAIAASVLETRSVNASVVAGVFTDVCGRLYGASGWCRLDQNGDRAALPMDVWFYTQDSRLYAGLYEPDRDTMSWNTGELGYTPAGP